MYARRKGTTWFIAAMNGLNEAKSINIDVAFLKGNYSLSAIKDDKNKQDNAVVENSILSGNSKMAIVLNANGGYVARLIKL